MAQISYTQLIGKAPLYSSFMQCIVPDDALASTDLQRLPGMPVEASLRTESRNVLSHLVKPLMDSVARTFRE